MSQDDVDEFVENPLGKGLDVGTQIFSGGLVGYDTKTGQLKKGYSSRGADEAIGEVSGRNAARGAADEARTAVAKEQADKANQLKAEAQRKQQLDTNASNYAASVRSTAQAQAKNSLGTSSTSDTDFLGL